MFTLLVASPLTGNPEPVRTFDTKERAKLYYDLEFGPYWPATIVDEREPVALDDDDDFDDLPW